MRRIKRELSVKIRRISENPWFLLSQYRSLSRVSNRWRGRDCVPSGGAGLFIITGQFVPVRACNSVQIINYFPFSKCQLAGELLCSSQPSAEHINKAEGA